MQESDGASTVVRNTERISQLERRQDRMEACVDKLEATLSDLRPVISALSTQVTITWVLLGTLITMIAGIVAAVLKGVLP